MKIILVAPPFGGKGEKVTITPVAPPALEYLAGLTRQACPEADLLLVDANVEEFNPAEVKADLIGFTVHTMQAPWVYQISPPEVQKNSGSPGRDSHNSTSSRSSKTRRLSGNRRGGIHLGRTAAGCQKGTSETGIPW